MKILVALHQCMDLGGIINHTEQLIGGLQDLGHEVHLKEFVWAMNARAQNKTADWKIGPSGIPHHQGKGWNFDSGDRVAYRGPANLYAAKKLLEEQDMVIWTVPVPSKNKNNLGNSDWPELYELPERIKTVAFIHDGNAVKGASHLFAVQEHLDAIACVHPCALNGAKIFDLNRALVVNPQLNPIRMHENWWDKSPGFVNMQTFKAWKHVHELVEAIRYMPPKERGELREIAGLGIEYRYMTSEDKCKDAYFHEDGERFWDAALENGMTHHDYWNSDEVDGWLREARILVDPSWSKSYSKIGGHFNRVVVDAMMRGCVPVARTEGMGDELFKANQHYIKIPMSADPQEYADIILEASHMATDEAQHYRDHAAEILPMFDRRTVAKRLIDLVHGNVDVERELNTITEQQIDKIEDILFNHFGVIL